MAATSGLLVSNLATPSVKRLSSSSEPKAKPLEENGILLQRILIVDDCPANTKLVNADPQVDRAHF